MMHNEKSAAGSSTLPRAALVALAAMFIFGSAVTEASARSRHHHRHHHHRHHHHHHHRHHAQMETFRDATASIGDSSGGRSFAGMASFYGNESGSRTASGQRFNAGGMTAAHRSLPFGTRLRVSYGGRSVIVTVNDRGPFIGGRVLDLSKGAAAAVGLTSRGVGRIVAEVL